MARRAKRRASNGARRRQPLRRVPANARWMHLSAGEVSTRDRLQSVWGWTSILCSYSSTMLAIASVVSSAADDNADMDAIQEMVEYITVSTVCYLSLLQMWRTMDNLLYDISPEEEEQPIRYTRRRHLRIRDLSDPEAHKMTHFYVDQLQRMYDMFGLEDFLANANEELVPLYTGHIAKGTPCRYLVHPEELFLFTLTKVATGRTNQSIVDEWFGGDYARWSHGYRWMLTYLDDRYENVVGHQGLARYVNEFPRFHRAIERFVQRDRMHENEDGTFVTIPGLEFLPKDAFAFMDDSIYGSSTPFSGPRGDYEGAARREEYQDTQRAVYTGYKKIHGIKVETVFLPNGITTLFGPVSARRSDCGVERMSNLNAFLLHLQHGMFWVHDGGAWLYYSVFGDGAFNIGKQCIQSYYRAIGAGGQLSDEEKKCNNAMKAARITIEKNYGMTSTIFRICNSREGFKLAQNNPYALEQLRVCHLLVNCYVCLNGDQASSDNTFGCNPPRLEEYLAL